MHLAFIFFQKEALIGPLAITQHGASLSLAYSVLAQIMHLASGIKLAEMSLVHFILPCEEQNLKSPLYMIRIRLCTILYVFPQRFIIINGVSGVKEKEWSSQVQGVGG